MASQVKGKRGGGKKLVHRMDDVYWTLIRRFPLRRLRTEAELDEASRIIDELIHKAHRKSGEQDYLDVLGDLVEAYEAEHHPIAPPSNAALLEFLMEARDVNAKTVAEATGIPEATLSSVLADKRDLSRGHIIKLSKFFNIEADTFQFNS
jgi:HTH-type transcriptional regulator/antitoxin HigA